MLHRPDEEGVIAISQPAHAWVAGQLSRQWGNGDFQSVPEEVCLASEQHDIGYLDWETSPTLNPDTGLPYTFLEMPRDLRLEIWTRGIRRMLRFGRYPALLVSMHYTWLANRNQRECPPNEQAWIDEFLEKQDALQTTLQTSLCNDFYYGPVSTAETLRRNQQLVSAWDWMSLLLCHRLIEKKFVDQIPTKSGYSGLTFSPLTPDGNTIQVSPWPFRGEQLDLVCEGRRLLKRYRDEEHLREAIRAAAPVTLAIKLVMEAKSSGAV